MNFTANANKALSLTTCLPAPTHPSFHVSRIRKCVKAQRKVHDEKMKTCFERQTEGWKKEEKWNLQNPETLAQRRLHPSDCWGRKCLASKFSLTPCGRMTFPAKKSVSANMLKVLLRNLTANVIVDSALRTKTKTSAFKQWLSIQSSRFCETSTPGESTNTTSSRNKLQRSRGQKMRTRELSHNFSWHKALASCFTD